MDTPTHDDDTEARLAESQKIEAEFAAKLAPRNANGHTMSPDYLATLPRSALEASRVTPEEQEEILFHYASTASIPKTVSLTRLPVEKVRAVIFNPSSSEPIRIIRDRLRVSTIEKIGETQVILLEAIQDPTKLSNASLREISNVFSEISASQISLMTATREASGPIELQIDPTKVFTGDELEYMAYLRRKVSIPSGSMGEPTSNHDEMSGHEFVDPGFSVATLDPGYEPIPDQNAAQYDPFSEEALQE